MYRALPVIKFAIPAFEVRAFDWQLCEGFWRSALGNSQHVFVVVNAFSYATLAGTCGE
jgi:hypothetical protein